MVHEVDGEVGGGETRGGGGAIIIMSCGTRLCKTREDGSHAGPCGTLSVPLGPLPGSPLSYTSKTTTESASMHTQIMMMPHSFLLLLLLLCSFVC